ncbi:MAG: hypothetical protein HFI64_14530 [Lachnospiraceae bacterium]|nr:hypothetical protein [Lachnospiraceae bacterium]
MSQRKHRSSLFLLELILVIFFFSLASAVCIQLFVKAHLTERETEALNRAIPLAESAAEAYHRVSGDLSGLAALFPEGRLNEAGDGFLVFYDEDWHPVEEGAYTLAIVPAEPSPGEPAEGAGRTLRRAVVRVSDADGIIYELAAAVQIPRTVP